MMQEEQQVRMQIRPDKTIHLRRTIKKTLVSNGQEESKGMQTEKTPEP